MLKHLLKLIWKRKKSNGLIIAEITIAFTIVFVIAMLVIRNYKLYIEPLGFEYQNMWNISIRGSAGSWEKGRDIPQLKQLLKQLKSQPDIDEVQVLMGPTFKNWTWTTSRELDGRTIRYQMNSMDDGAADSFGMKLVSGRWFGVEDDGQNYTPLIVNRLFSETYFKDKDLIGLNIAETEPNEDGESAREQRIVGVFEDFRQHGELSALTPYVISRYDFSEGAEIRNIEVKITDHTTIAYEEKLMSLLKGIVPSWDFSITPWKVARKSELEKQIFPLVSISIISAFFILLVALGLFGVLWQNVSSRTAEIGLRRAHGATARSVHLQIISEQLIVTFLGVLIGVILLIQIPLLGSDKEITWELFWSAQAAAFLFMLFLSIVCAYYPGKLATSLSPAEALHYE
ncbi:MAG: FtsX-like permease family protein [Kangiellaceae bacterium]|nr:FtsX-like permease family protein [Kangiellaceae bacterium]